jgi:hypothetical protein
LIHFKRRHRTEHSHHTEHCLQWSAGMDSRIERRRQTTCIESHRAPASLSPCSAGLASSGCIVWSAGIECRSLLANGIKLCISKLEVSYTAIMWIKLDPDESGTDVTAYSKCSSKCVDHHIHSDQNRLDRLNTRVITIQVTITVEKTCNFNQNQGREYNMDLGLEDLLK